ncbi:D-alanyl-D-alanine carboxypeptidase [Formicincola oecophyllae]|uniref:serine-type D-Ala-D-Ala carboxypeptidase n=1 Tax=Formicincola oecophyllae TaxID=2558361 RepID=A0A4Y6UA28_9PROT|nr:D-alanyl-D-alanine carboxypeptidase family protein [Formicincola oecophyllae]QDH14252.1 D-alanyl-D-alanine carboxypeptidase [Formicincola oecophyllae]
MLGSALLVGAPGQALARPHRRGKGKGASTAAGAGSLDVATTPLGTMPTSARWAYIVDNNTGTVLLEKNANERMPPSSLTKMMTAYVVFTFLAAGRLSLDQSLPVSDRAWRLQGSKMFVPQGGSVKVSDLIQGMVVQSGNDACIVLAEGIAGSEERFAALMNQAAQRLGMNDTHFVNATGLPSPEHYMSARDISVLARALLHDFPQYYHFFGEKEFTFNGITQGNRNVLVLKDQADGFKTGHTDAGGFGLCASSERPNGQGGKSRMIMVINGTPSTNARAHEGERLMSWAFANFSDVPLAQKNRPVVPAAPVWMGTRPTVPLEPGVDYSATLPADWRGMVSLKAHYDSPLVAPLTAGQPCGSMDIFIKGQLVKTVPLVAAEDVPRAGLLERAMRRLRGHG